MQTDGQESLTPQPVVENPPTNERQLIAPLWHTIMLIMLMLAVSYSGSKSSVMGGGTSPRAQALAYVPTMVWELILLLIVWFGIRMRGVKMRELIGGRWDSIENFLIDVGIAIGCVFAAYVVVFIGAALTGLANPKQVSEARKLAEMVGPGSPPALASFIVLSTFAGVIEEIVFRGYLQKQFAALTGNVYLGLILQAIIFGMGHGYEGIRRMLVIFALGCFFGVLALLRKSLRPGMMTHAVFDSLQGIGLYLMKKGMIPVG